jgi:L-serine dehydratase
MSVDRKGRSGEAVTVIDIDGLITDELIEEIEQLSTIREVKKVDLTEGSKP